VHSSISGNVVLLLVAASAFLMGCSVVMGCSTVFGGMYTNAVVIVLVILAFGNPARSVGNFNAHERGSVLLGKLA
jgi:hypothetical protein